MTRADRGAAAAACLWLSLVLPAGATEAESPVRVEATADREAITLGDPIVVTIRILAPPGAAIETFAPETELGDLALVGRESRPASVGQDGRTIEERILKVTAFTIGPHEIPGFSAAYRLPDGTRGTARSGALTFTVASVVPPDDNHPADIRPPAVMPLAPRWPWILAGLAAATAGAWWWRRRRRRPEEVAAGPAAPSRPAHEIAYAELERLLAGGLLEAGRIKEFHIALAEIARRYLAARFGVDTFERTTSEILAALHAERLPAKITTTLADLLSACDLVKFAKFRPDPETTRATVAQAYRLVDETRPADPAASATGIDAPPGPPAREAVPGTGAAVSGTGAAAGGGR
jgi:hypothetical protein